MGMEMFMGIKIIENPAMDPDRNNQTLNPGVQVTDAFRSEFNAWLRDFFGVQPNILMTNAAPFSKSIITHPRNVMLIKAQAKANANFD
jgi:hypothetical protein